MKKSIIYALIIALGLSLTSCKDFLEEKAYGNPTSEELLKSADNMALLVGQAYAELKWLHDHWGYWGLNTLTSDEARCPVRNPGDNWNDNGYWADLNTMDWTYEGLAFELVWDKCISGATLCNKILKQISAYQDVVDAAMYKRFVGELCVLRSYYYYTMFDLFGRIPYTEEFPESETAQFPLLDKAEVWHKLVASLEANAANLPIATDPSKAQNYGRATQGLAYALLARLYLNAPSYDVTDVDQPYDKCVQYCDAVINSGAYTIEDNFFTNFQIYNESSDENIFVIVENGNAAFDYQDVAGKMSNKLRINLLTQHYAFQTIYGLLEKPWNGFAASEQFLDLYDPADRRGPCPEDAGTDIDFQDKTKKYGWFLGPVKKDGEVMVDENGTPVIITKSFKTGMNAKWGEGARCFKYETEVNAAVNKYSENDFVLFRYADVLYMKAEACLRGAGNGNIGSVLGLADFQRIRTRVGLEPYDASLTLDELLNERGREFAWENVRRRDLIRFGKYTDPAYHWDFKSTSVEPYKKWFPIPKKMLEIHANDRIPWTQNEGY